MQLIAAAPLNAPPEFVALAADVFSALSTARFATLGSVMAFAGPSGLTLELIELWCRAGLLHRARVKPDPLAAHEVEYLALTTAGARALAAATGRRTEGLTAARLKRSSQKRMHDVLVGEVALAAITLGREGLIELVGVECDDRKLANVVHTSEVGKEPERIVLQPDALLVTEGPLGKEALLVEVDRGTTAPVRMRDRYRGYLAWQRDLGPQRDFGIKALRVVTLVPNAARLTRLHDAALEASGGRRSGFLLFGLQSELSVCTAERLTEPLAMPLGAENGQRVRLLSARAGTASGSIV